jgi:hypothetical protein
LNTGIVREQLVEVGQVVKAVASRHGGADAGHRVFVNDVAIAAESFLVPHGGARIQIVEQSFNQYNHIPFIRLCQEIREFFSGEYLFRKE